MLQPGKPWFRLRQVSHSSTVAQWNQRPEENSYLYLLSGSIFFFFLVLAVITALIKCRSFFPLITGWSGRRMGEERLDIAGCSDVLQAQQEICSSSICWQCRGVLYHLSLDVLKGWIISQHHLQHSSFNSPTVLYWRNTEYNNGICLWMCLFFFLVKISVQIYPYIYSNAKVLCTLTFYTSDKASDPLLQITLLLPSTFQSIW